MMLKIVLVFFVVLFGGCGGSIDTVKNQMPSSSAEQAEVEKSDSRNKVSEIENIAAITAGDDQHVLEGSQIMLLSSRLDKSHEFIEYRWKESDKLYSTEKKCLIEPLDKGEHEIILEAVDTDGKVFKDSVKVVVKSLGNGNHLPQAKQLFFTTAEDTLFKGALQGSDADGDALKYVLVSLPEHGTLSGSAAHLQYMPDADFYGEDKFFFKTNDGSIDSEYASVTITVEPRNDAPVAKPISVSTTEDQALNFQLSASDKENDLLVYSIVAAPSHGTVSLTGNNVLYTPRQGFSGVDSFLYKSSDGVADSQAATVTIYVTSVNHAPVAIASTIEISEDTPVDITLQANDIDSEDNISFRLLSTPQLGSATITGNVLYYVPLANKYGTEVLRFVANDGQVDSAEATVTITVNPQNDAPVADALMIQTLEDIPKDIVLSATDVEGDALTFEVVSQPSHGTTTIIQNQVRYIPQANYYGIDSFTYRANDGSLNSNIATVSISVAPVNDTPEVVSQSYSVVQNSSVNITLSGTDIDGDSLAYMHTVPVHGVLSGSGKDLVYTPSPDYTGTDAFEYWVNDGNVDSAKKSVTITVTQLPNSVPVAQNITKNFSEDSSVDITLLATDSDNDTLTYSIEPSEKSTKTS